MKISELKSIKDVKVKESIPFKHKFVFMENLFANKEDGSFNIIDIENGIAVCNCMMADIIFDIAAIELLTDIEFSENSTEEYDIAVQSGIVKALKNSLIYQELYIYYYKRIDTIINNHNNTMIVFNNEMKKLVDAAIEFLNELPNRIDKKTIQGLMTKAKEIHVLKDYLPESKSKKAK